MPSPFSYSKESRSDSKVFAFALILSLVAVPSARAGGWTTAQWRAVFNAQVKEVVTIYFALLGKNYTVLPLILSRQIQVDTTHLFLLRKKSWRSWSKSIQELPPSANPARTLRDAYLLRTPGRLSEE